MVVLPMGRELEGVVGAEVELTKKTEAKSEDEDGEKIKVRVSKVNINF